MAGPALRSQKSKVKTQKSKPRTHALLPFDLFLCLLVTPSCLLFTSCRIGPDYKRPPAPAPSAYKELPPANSPQASEWAPALPNDAISRGKWWEIYNDSELNFLEEQVSISNQNHMAAEAQFREAKLNVR